MMQIRELTEDELKDAEVDLFTDHVAIVRGGGNAIVLDADGNPREGPVSRDGSVKVFEVEFPAEQAPDKIVEQAEEKLRAVRAS